MFRNNVMGASPDGLVFTDPHAACAVGILEVKCPYSLRDVKVEYPAQWHNYLNYIDCNNNLKKTHDYYHQIQGAMAAVGVGLVRLCHLDPEQYEDSTNPSR